MPLNSEPAQKLMLSVFIRGSKHLKTMKALRLRRRAFIRFSVFGTPDENLALVFDLLHETLRLMLDILLLETNGQSVPSDHNVSWKLDKILASPPF